VRRSLDSLPRVHVTSDNGGLPLCAPDKEGEHEPRTARLGGDGGVVSFNSSTERNDTRMNGEAGKE